MALDKIAASRAGEGQHTSSYKAVKTVAEAHRSTLKVNL